MFLTKVNLNTAFLDVNMKQRSWVRRHALLQQPRHAYLYSFIFVGVFFISGCQLSYFAKVPEDHQQAFLFGVERSQLGHHELALRAGWSYLSASDEDDPRYDRTLRLLARSAEALNLTYAASVWYLQIASGRRDPELIPEAVTGIKNIVESGVYDEDALIHRYIAVEELSSMGSEIDSFVHFYQGLQSFRQDRKVWAFRHFRMIHQRSEYRLKARFVSAVRNIALGKLKIAQTSLVNLLKELSSDHESVLMRDLWRDVMITLARLAMQRDDVSTALEHFEAVRERVPDDPELLLEIAWAHHLKGSPRRALGFLIALDAPVYQNLIAPERYILEAMTYRSLCHFGPARQAAVRLNQRYNLALDDLYGGVLPERSKALRQAAGLRPELRPLTLFIQSLDREMAVVKSLEDALGSELTQGLLDLYQRGRTAAEVRREGALREEIGRLAEELLSAEEGVRLITHELGVALLRGRKPPEGRGPVPPLEEIATQDQVVYHFRGEFWTDELDELIVAAEDRCIDQ